MPVTPQVAASSESQGGRPPGNGVAAAGGAPATAGSAPAPSSASSTAADLSVFQVSEEGITWTCSRCESVNEFDDAMCSVCGIPFASAIRSPEPERPMKDASKAALLSLFLPGAGHAYLDMWGKAAARAVVSVGVLAVAFFGGSNAAPQAKLMAVLFGLAGVALWIIAAHDAYREAGGNSAAVLLKDKVFVYVFLGLMALSVLLGFSMILQVAPRP